MFRRRLPGVLFALPLLLLVPARGPVAASGALRRPAAPPATEFEAASAAEEDAIGAVLAVGARRSALEARVRELDARAAIVGDRARQRAIDLARVDQAQRNLEARLLRTRVRFVAAQVRARHAAAQMYRGAGSTTPPVLGLLGGNQSIRDVALGERYLARVADRVMQDVDALSAARRQVVVAGRRLRSQRAAVERSAAAARREQDLVVAMRADQDRVLAAARAEEERENVVLAAARARRVEFERAAAVGQAASGTIEDILAARPVTGRAPTQLRFPAVGPVTSGFGPRVHPIFGTVRLHSGIDIGASYGTTVQGGTGGVVVVAGAASGYGNAVVVDHGGGIATLYGHLSRFGVRVGQTVAAGQTVGAVGSTGNSTGPHLHFEVRARGVPVDPMRYL